MVVFLLTRHTRTDKLCAHAVKIQKNWGANVNQRWAMAQWTISAYLPGKTRKKLSFRRMKNKRCQTLADKTKSVQILCFAGHQNTFLFKPILEMLF